MTPTTVGWVMADGRADDCPTVSGDEFGVTRDDAGLDAANMAASVSAVAGRVRSVLAGRGDRLHGVGVTWSDDAAVGAALALETLADAGFDNVVPVRFSQAAATLTGGIGLRGERPAVCVIEPGLATLVLCDRSGGGDPVVTACPVGSTDDVIGRLAEVFGSAPWRPEVLMVAGSMRGMDRLARRLESRLSVPVFVQAGAQQALARGAALALAPHADLAGGLPAAATAGPVRSMSLSYAGALTMLAGGAVTFVASVSAALSLHLGPINKAREVRPPEHVTVARVVVPAPPPAAPVVPPPDAPAEAAPDAPAQPPVEVPEEPAELGALWEGPAAVPGPPAGPASLLDRVRDRMPRVPGR